MALVKLVVYVPVEDEEKVRLALGAAGAGHIGDYDYCSFVSKGTGHFRPLAGTNPHIGAHGEIADVDECRIQTVCDEQDLPRVLKALRDSHPYEEVAYDIVPLLNEKYREYVPKQAAKKSAKDERDAAARK